MFRRDCAVVVRKRDRGSDSDGEGARSEGEAMQDELTVLVADDHAGYRAGLVRAISAWNGLRLVGEAGDGASALRMIEEHEPDLALIDVRMPQLNGLEVCAQLAPDHPTRVVLVSAFMDDKLAAAAAASGAADCISKHVSRTQICRKLVAVAQPQDSARAAG
jgi:two-component system, NarL family, nitrate/nitrite response regulator NarL